MNPWQIAGICATIAGASVAVARYLTVPKIKGEIEALQPGSDVPGGPEMRLWILAYVGLYNSRAAPTSLKSLVLTARLQDGEERVLDQDLGLSESYWDQALPSGRPTKRAFFHADHLEQRDRHEGWVAFRCGLEELDAREYVISAVDARGKRFKLKPYKPVAQSLAAGV
jgi:hypothetical protein